MLRLTKVTLKRSPPCDPAMYDSAQFVHFGVSSQLLHIAADRLSRGRRGG